MATGFPDRAVLATIADLVDHTGVRDVLVDRPQAVLTNFDLLCGLKTFCIENLGNILNEMRREALTSKSKKCIL